MRSQVLKDPATELERLARARFVAPPLTAAEIRLLGAAQSGDVAVCGSYTNRNSPDNDPSKGDLWNTDRQIRAALIRWLCVDRHAKDLIDPLGIQIWGAKVTEPINLDSVAVSFPLRLLRCRLMENLTLVDAQMPLLDMQESQGRAVRADRATVRGSVLLREFRADGEVDFRGASIGGTFDCRGAQMNKPPTPKNPETDFALVLDRAVVNGSVFLRKGFSANGVLLSDARIGGTLDCRQSKISGRLTLAATVMKDGFIWAENQGVQTILDLTNASTDALNDDRASWPPAGNLFMDGFVYGGIRNGPKDAKSRLDWLARQVPFAPQPYRQLAAVLKDSGDESGANTVLIEMEQRLRATDWFSECESWLFRETVGYGYRPLRAVGGLAILWGVGWIVYRRALLTRAMTPVDKDAYDSFKGQRTLPEHFTRFFPPIYSLENSIPLIKFGLADKWRPDPNRTPILKEPLLPKIKRVVMTGLSRTFWARYFRRLWRVAVSPRLLLRLFLRWTSSPVFLQRFLWFQIIVGWILATLIVAGIAGLIHRN